MEGEQVHTAHHRDVLLVGASDAGKSNYLFRLWLALCDGNCVLSRRGLPDDLAYLEDGVAMLQQGQFAPKTPRHVQVSNAIPVAGREHGVEAEGTLVVPDCFGEKWQSVFTDRRWPRTWDSHIANKCGCLIFVRAASNNIVSSLDWVSWHEMMGPLADSSHAAALQPAHTEAPIPTQVMVVDWLQCLRETFTELVGAYYRPRIGLVVSAWDLVPEDMKNAHPAEYVDQNFSLLKDFMDTNDLNFEFEIFGLTVTGCDLGEGPDVVDAYLECGAANSGYVVHSLNGRLTRSPDQCVPAAWAMGFDCTPATKS